MGCHLQTTESCSSKTLGILGKGILWDAPAAFSIRNGGWLGSSLCWHLPVHPSVPMAPASHPWALEKPVTKMGHGFSGVRHRASAGSRGTNLTWTLLDPGCSDPPRWGWMFHWRFRALLCNAAASIFDGIIKPLLPGERRGLRTGALRDGLGFWQQNSGKILLDTND